MFEILGHLFLGMPIWVWLAFLATVVVILSIDLGLLHGEAHEPTLKESMVLAGACMTLGVSFSAVVWWLYYNGVASSLDDDIVGAARLDLARPFLYACDTGIARTLAAAGKIPGGLHRPNVARRRLSIEGERHERDEARGPAAP